MELIHQDKAWLCTVDDLEGDLGKPLHAEKIGWQDGEHYWLFPDGTFAMIQSQATRTGRPLTFTRREIQERLHECGVLIRDDPTRWNSRLNLVEGRPWLMKLARAGLSELLG